MPDSSFQSLLTSLAEIGRTAPDPSTLLQRMAERINRTLGAHTTSIYLAKSGLSANSGVPAPDPAFRGSLLKSEGLLGWVARTKEPLVASELDAAPLSSRPNPFPEAGIHNMVSAPLLWRDNEVLGVLVCHGLPPQRFRWKSKVRRDIGLLAACISPYIAANYQLSEHLLSVEHMGHELKSGLGTIRDNANKLASEDLSRSADSRRRLRAISSLSEMLMTSVETASIALGGIVTPHLERRDILNEVINPVVELLSGAAKRRSQSLSVEKAELGGLRVSIDRRLLQLAVFNLIDNAIKYSDEKSDISISAGRYGNDKVEVRIASWGVGIDQDDAEQIFSPGYRSSRAVRRTIAGKGLGLATCRRVMEAHGGEVSLASHGRPTVFVLRLPIVS